MCTTGTDLHPKLEARDRHVPAGNLTRDSEWEASTVEMSHTNCLITIRNLYMAAPVHVAVTHGLILEAQARIEYRLIGTGTKLLIAFTQM